MSTELGSTTLLLGAIVLALAWANFPIGDSYETVWHTPLSLRLGDLALTLDLRHWINDGLMALFFFVIGMEATREFVLGEIGDRRVALVPALAALGGLAVPAGIYLALNPSGPAASGWGIPMATDTAFVLALMAMTGPRCPQPLRVFLLVLSVVDDVGAILVVAVAYTRELSVPALLAAVAGLVVLETIRRLGVRWPPVYVVLAAAIWVAAVLSGVHPTVVGIALGILVTIYNPRDTQVLRAGELAQEFAREPTPRRGRAAAQSLRAAVPPNERLQLWLHPWTSYFVLPLFVLANAGIPLTAEVLSEAVTSPVTIGVVAGLVIGKLAGVCLGSWVGLRFRSTTLPGNLVWGQLTGGAALAGVGFTISLFIAELAFTSQQLRTEAKVGILFGSLIAATLGWLIFRLAWQRGSVCAPPDTDDQGQQPGTLAEPVADRDHARGGSAATVTIVEYGDFECPYCGLAQPVLDELLDRYEDRLRLVFRHFPLRSVHPHAQRAALAAEAAAAQDRFWPMHDQLYAHQRELDDEGLATHAEHAGIDRDSALPPASLRHGNRVHADENSGRDSGVRGTPTFFINGEWYGGGHDIDSFSAAIDAAEAAKSREYG